MNNIRKRKAIGILAKMIEDHYNRPWYKKLQDNIKITYPMIIQAKYWQVKDNIFEIVKTYNKK